MSRLEGCVGRRSVCTSALRSIDSQYALITQNRSERAVDHITVIISAIMMYHQRYRNCRQRYHGYRQRYH